MLKRASGCYKVRYFSSPGSGETEVATSTTSEVMCYGGGEN